MENLFFVDVFHLLLFKNELKDLKWLHFKDYYWVKQFIGKSHAVISKFKWTFYDAYKVELDIRQVYDIVNVNYS